MTEPIYTDYPVSWDEIHRLTKKLAHKLLPMGPWKGIAAVTRGGLVPACIVARELNIRLIETICIASYDHQNQGSANILKRADMIEDGGKGWLVVDDLVDSGNTYRIIRDMLPNAHYAAVYAKPKGAETTDSYVLDVEQNSWIFFPWDMDTRFSTPLVDEA